MTEHLSALLLRLSEPGDPAILWGRLAKPFLGQEFDRLLARGVLTEQAPADEWDVCADCECGHDGRRIQQVDGKLIAACPLDHRSDTVLEPEDLRSFRIGIPALVRELAAASGFGTTPSEIVPGVWRLGALPSGRVAFLGLSRPRATALGLVGMIRLADQAASVVLVCPELDAAETARLAEADIIVVPLARCLVPQPRGVGCAIDQMQLEPAPARRTRLVLRRQSRVAEFDGVGHQLSEQEEKLLSLLIEKVDEPSPYASTVDIERCIWGREIHKVSRTARDVVRELREALLVGAADPEMVGRLIVNKRQLGWRLALPVSEIAVLDV